MTPWWHLGRSSKASFDSNGKILYDSQDPLAATLHAMAELFDVFQGLVSGVANNDLWQWKRLDLMIDRFIARSAVDDNGVVGGGARLKISSRPDP